MHTIQNTFHWTRGESIHHLPNPNIYRYRFGKWNTRTRHRRTRGWPTCDGNCTSTLNTTTLRKDQLPVLSAVAAFKAPLSRGTPGAAAASGARSRTDSGSADDSRTDSSIVVAAVVAAAVAVFEAAAEIRHPSLKNKQITNKVHQYLLRENDGYWSVQAGGGVPRISQKSSNDTVKPLGIGTPVKLFFSRFS